MSTVTPLSVFKQLISLPVIETKIGFSMFYKLTEMFSVNVKRISKETFEVSLVDTPTRKESLLGKLDLEQFHYHGMSAVANLVQQYMFQKVLTVHGIDDIFQPDHKFTKETYERLRAFAKRDNVFEIKTNDWKPWCKGPMTEITNDYYSLNLFQNTSIVLTL
ncbi:hypothetical protein [Aeromonas phage AerS_266]|nr:hypothetical protein [Aeromonas phage AerS_266]